MYLNKLMIASAIISIAKTTWDIGGCPKFKNEEIAYIEYKKNGNEYEADEKKEQNYEMLIGNDRNITWFDIYEDKPQWYFGEFNGWNCSSFSFKHYLEVN